MFRFPFDRVNWVTSSFLIGTLVLALTAAPWYILTFGLSWFQIGLFFFFLISTGLSITLGYHRLFSHLAFEAAWPVKLYTLLFGAAAFENSVLDWCSDHRRHHKHVDHDDDPYDINKGFFHAHIGWLLFKLKGGDFDNVPDLMKDKLVVWQHKHIYTLGIVVGFLLPMGLGYWVEGPIGALGGLLIAGVLRIVCVQHSTFFINSLCHCVGRQTYSSKCSARDSHIMAFFTFGEGYHNFHHEFQHDYRNGVKPWTFDPTKWTIWVLAKLGLAKGLRRVPTAKIAAAELAEAQRRLAVGLQAWHEHLPETARAVQQQALERLQSAQVLLEERVARLQEAARNRLELSRQQIEAWRRDTRQTLAEMERLLRQAGVPQPSFA